MELWQWHCQNRMKKKIFQLVCGNAIAEIRGKKKILGNCGNPIAENGNEKKKKGFRNSINVAVAFVLVVFLFH